MAVERRDGDALANAAGRGRGRQRRAGDDRRGAVAVFLAVVLADPDVVDAQAAGFGGEDQAVAIGLLPALAEIGATLEAHHDSEARKLHDQAATDSRCVDAHHALSEAIIGISRLPESLNA